MDPVHVLILALLQGVAELFPVSSLGHTIIIPGLLGWNETLHSPQFLPLVVTLHLGTAVALLTFFWRDWVDLLRGGMRVLIAGKFTPDVDPQGHGRQLALVVIGTIPAGLIGVLFQKPLEALFANPLPVSLFLFANGFVLLTSERLYRVQQAKAAALVPLSSSGTLAFQPGAASDAVPITAKRNAVTPSGEVGLSISDMTFLQALLIGSSQIFALLPGFSRSGLTIAAGMSNKLSHEAAARFSFLLATPIIFAAGVLEIPTLLGDKNALVLALAGGVLAGISAYLSVRFLMRYFETNRLDPFAYYCMAAGALSFGYFLLRSMKVLP